MAVGTGFAQLLRGLGSFGLINRKMCQFTSIDDDFFSFFLGQVGGLASASAVFQSRLDTELHERLPPGSEEVCLATTSSFQVAQFSGIDHFFFFLFFSFSSSQAYQKNPPFSTSS